MFFFYGFLVICSPFDPSKRPFYFLKVLFSSTFPRQQLLVLTYSVVLLNRASRAVLLKPADHFFLGGVKRKKWPPRLGASAKQEMFQDIEVSKATSTSPKAPKQLDLKHLKTINCPLKVRLFYNVLHFK